MNEQPPLDDLVGPVREHLLPLLQDALEACAERHNVAVGRGADHYSFGTDAWSLPARLFRDDKDNPFGPVTGPGCVLNYNGVPIHHHRVGESEADDIAVSFPEAAQGLRKKIGRQMELQFESEPVCNEVEPVVLAYMANRDDGLCAVYLARVGSILKGKIVEWSETVEVWTAGTASVPTETTEQVEAELVAEPEVVRVARRVKKNEQ